LFLGEELSTRLFMGAAFVLIGIATANGEIVMKQWKRKSLPDTHNS
jgi:drug/metabolite transporter (DMT)-like permease